MPELNLAHRILIPHKRNTPQSGKNQIFYAYTVDKNQILPDTVPLQPEQIKALLIDASLIKAEDEKFSLNWTGFIYRLKKYYALKLIIWQGKLEKSRINELLSLCDVVFLTQEEETYSDSIPNIWQNLEKGYSIREVFRRIERQQKRGKEGKNIGNEDKWKINYYSPKEDKDEKQIQPIMGGIYANLPTNIEKVYTSDHSLSWSFNHPQRVPYQPSDSKSKVWTDPFGSHSARIKDIYIELEDYTFFHSPSGLDSQDERLIGRKDAFNRLRTILKNSKSKAGAYLITGFRGMGKTSLVRKVLRSIKPSRWSLSPKRKIIIEISLAQDDLKDVDILRLLARKTYSEYQTFLKPFASLHQFLRTLFYLFLGVLFLLCANIVRNNILGGELIPFVRNLPQIETQLEWYIVAFWMISIILLMAFHVLIPIIQEVLGLTHHKTILRRLYWLNEKINAELSLERVKGFNPTFQTPGSKIAGIQFGNRSIRKYALAGAKEIEGELVSILKKIDELFLWWIVGKPEFIYVFDELDKIDPHHNVSIIEKEAEDPDMLLNEKGEYVTESIRKRQQAIANILSNLKHFLNVAKAKFIFIAGRELYDAALADISDRDAFWTSIFHETIYIESFLKDKSDEKSSGITSMTEEYVCQFLIPKDFRKNHNEERVGLKLFNKYLDEKIFDFDNRIMCLNPHISREEYNRCKEELKKMREKTIYAVQNLIIYLTYRSNGTPKQLTSLFEKYIYTQKIGEIISQSKNLVSTRNKDVDKERLFLQFDFHDQYKFGLITYLFRPYLISNSRYMKGLDDKLLVATSYLTDHLFKFHPFGFSWKSLELTPEVITINRAPELRRLVEKLMHSLLNLHLREIENGLFQFKFYSKTASEISYISRTFDLESAGFNFTLDESLMIKRHYKKKLRRLKEAFKNHNRNQDRSDYVHSIGFIDSILGDLHYYDVEYDDAIVQYDDAIQHLRHQSTGLTIHQFLLLLRNRLKIGLILEKMKTYDSALVTYGSLIEDSKCFLLEDKKGKKEFPKEIFKEGQQAFFQAAKLVLLPFLAKLQALEKSALHGLTWEDISVSNHSVSTLLKKLKIKQSELLEANYLRNIGTLLYFKNGKLSEKSENKRIPSELQWPKESSVNSLILSTDKIEGWFHIGDDFLLHPDFRAPISAYQFYRVSLQKLLEQLYHYSDIPGPHTINEPLPKITIDYLFKDHRSLGFAGTSKNQFMAMGHTLSKLGDCILGFLASGKGKGKNELLFINTSMFGALLDLDYVNQNSLNEVLNFWEKIKNDSLEMVVLHYVLAGLYYRKGGKTISYEFQLRKILYVLKDFISFSSVKGQKKKIQIAKIDNIDEEFLKSLNKPLMFNILRALSWANDGTNRPQIFKAMDIFDIHRETKAKESKSIYNSISLHPDTKEPNLLLAEIKLKMSFKDEGKEGDVASLSHTLVNPYASVSSRFVRVQELIYRSQLNLFYLKKAGFRDLLNIDLDKKGEEVKEKYAELEKIFKQINPKTEAILFKAFGRPFSAQQAIEHLIIDSLYCLLEAIKALKVFGTSYMVSYSYMGYTYKKLGDWSHWFQVYRNFLREREGPKSDNLKMEGKFMTKLAEMIGSNTIHYLQKRYYYELGISNLFSALEVHHEGRAYADLVKNMYILEDDFNDNFIHFCAALERYRINVGAIRANINGWNKVAEKSRPYYNENYVRPSNAEEDEMADDEHRL